MAWEQTISKNATTADTIKLIVATVNQYYTGDFINRKAQELQPTGDKFLYLKRLFDDVYTKVKYKLDTPPVEKVYTPERTYREGYGDCKKMATIIACVLQNVGINCYLKYVEFCGKDYSHIYVIVPFPTLERYVTLDPVNDGLFDKEVSYDKGTLYDLNGQKMELKLMGKTTGRRVYTFADNLAYTNATIDNDISSLAGCKCSGIEPSPNDLPTIYAALLTSDFNTLRNPSITPTSQQPTQTRELSIGRLSKEERKARRQRILEKFKNVSLALPRTAFLFLVRVNPKGLANKLAHAWTKDATAVSKFWERLGGDPEALKQSILSGSTVPPLEAPVQVQGMGAVTLAAVTSAVVTATPIIVAAAKLVQDLKAAAPPGSTDEQNEAAADDFDQKITEMAEGGVDSGWIDADLKSAAYSGNRPGSNEAVLKYSPEALLKYYADNGIDLNKVYQGDKVKEAAEQEQQKQSTPGPATDLGSFTLNFKQLFFSPWGFVMKLPFFVMGLQACSVKELVVIGGLITAVSIHSLIKK